jgi:hypothetical protein
VTVSWWDASVKKYIYTTNSTCPSASWSYTTTTSTSFDQTTETNNGKYICLYAEDANGNSTTLRSASTIHVDNTPPTATLTTTNEPSQTSQTATLSCADGVWITSYYRWTTSPTQSSTYTNITSTTSFSTWKTINNSWTYYFACKDVAGNISEVKSITYVKYQIKNMLDTITWTQWTYTTENYALDNPTTPTYYIISWWTSLTLSDLCTDPSISSSMQITSVWEPSSSVSATNTPTTNVDNQTYACWYDRTLYDLTLTKNTWIETIYCKVNGASDYANTWTSTTVQMKAWSDASVYAVASNGYTCASSSCYSSESPLSWSDITENKTFSPNTTMNTYTITYNLNWWTNNPNNPWSYTTESWAITLQAPTKTWYTFLWWTWSNGNTPQTGVIIPAWSYGNKTYNAVWQANSNTQYIVYHYVKRVWQNTYELMETQTGHWVTDSTLILSWLVKPGGFVCATYDKWSLTWTESWPWAIVTETTINWDWSTKIYLYYNRNRRNVTLSGDEHIERLMMWWEETSEAVRECGSEVPVDAIPKPWYHFVRWEEVERTEEEWEDDNEPSWN